MQIESLIGRRITAVRPIAKRELAEMGWDDHNSHAVEIELDAGAALIYASSDEEQNGAGVLMIATVEKCGGLFIQNGKAVIL